MGRRARRSVRFRHLAGPKCAAIGSDCRARIVLVTGLRVRRYSPSHVVAQLTVAGRGLYLSRTSDGTWWRLQLRRGCPARQWPEPEDPPDIGTREPRRPRGPQPTSSSAAEPR